MRTAGWFVAAVLVLGLALAGTGCSAGGDAQDPKALEANDWQLVSSYRESAALAAAGITAAFDGTRISGFSGVNQYGGSYTAGEDGAFEVGEIVSTLMAGPPEKMAAEQAYLEILEVCDEYAVSAEQLVLKDGDEVALTFEPVAAVQLPGSSWSITNYNNGKQAVTSPIEGSTLSIAFGEDASVSGESGVNTFNGPYESGDKTISIGPLMSTKMAGSDEMMEQEAAILAALQKAAEWKIVQGNLELRSSDGALQIAGAPK